jgi:hypothetical protein
MIVVPITQAVEIRSMAVLGHSEQKVTSTPSQQTSLRLVVWCMPVTPATQEM